MAHAQQTNTEVLSELLNLNDYSRYTSPINPNVYPHLAVVLSTIGLFFLAMFFVYEVTANKFTRQLSKEIIMAILASIFLGLGILFLMLMCGIYV